MDSCVSVTSNRCCCFPYDAFWVKYRAPLNGKNVGWLEAHCQAVGNVNWDGNAPSIHYASKFEVPVLMGRWMAGKKMWGKK